MAGQRDHFSTPHSLAHHSLHPLLWIKEPFVFLDGIAIRHPGQVVADDALQTILSLLRALLHFGRELKTILGVDCEEVG